jgi:hypothetical protein
MRRLALGRGANWRYRIAIALRFNAEGPRGLLNGKAPGTPNIVDDSQRQALRHIVEDGPMPAVHGVVRWRLIDLAELNPVENIWQFMRDNWLSNRVFKSYDEILDLMFMALVFIHNLVSEEQPP